MLRIIQIFCLYVCCMPLTPWALGKKDTINILSWVNYLSLDGASQLIEQKCNVRISYDNYYSNDEFLRRWHKTNQKYDVIIFSETIYPMIKKQVS